MTAAGDGVVTGGAAQVEVLAADMASGFELSEVRSKSRTCLLWGPQRGPQNRFPGH